jgi:hypothetical protein
VPLLPPRCTQGPGMGCRYNGDSLLG